MSKIVRGLMGGGRSDAGAAAEVARLQAEQQSRIAAERAQLEEQKAASLKARAAGRRGLLAFVEDSSLVSTLGGG